MPQFCIENDFIKIIIKKTYAEKVVALLANWPQIIQNLWKSSNDNVITYYSKLLQSKQLENADIRVSIKHLLEASINIALMNFYQDDLPTVLDANPTVFIPLSYLHNIDTNQFEIVCSGMGSVANS